MERMETQVMVEDRQQPDDGPSYDTYIEYGADNPAKILFHKGMAVIHSDTGYQITVEKQNDVFTINAGNEYGTETCNGRYEFTLKLQQMLKRAFEDGTVSVFLPENSG